MLRPTANAVKANYMLEVTFDNGKTKVFDVKPYIKSSWYGQLEDKSYFGAVSTDRYTVVWLDGQDLC